MIPRPEPTADVRFAASQARALYNAFTEVGFTEDESFTLTRDVFLDGLNKNGASRG